MFVPLGASDFGVRLVIFVHTIVAKNFFDLELCFTNPIFRRKRSVFPRPVGFLQLKHVCCELPEHGHLTHHLFFDVSILISGILAWGKRVELHRDEKGIDHL